MKQFHVRNRYLDVECRDTRCNYNNELSCNNQELLQIWPTSAGTDQRKGELNMRHADPRGPIVGVFMHVSIMRLVCVDYES